MSKKYEITDIQHPTNKQLRRIRALRDIPTVGVKAGDLGGWIEREHNLSQAGDAWVADEARIFDTARVDVFALVSGHAVVHEGAMVAGSARVYDHADVSGVAWVFGSAQVLGSVVINGNMRVTRDALVASDEDILHDTVEASESFDAFLYRTTDGHELRVGCWHGTVPEFRAMIESDKWVEATPEQIELRRPELLAFAAMCEARIATWEPR